MKFRDWVEREAKRIREPVINVLRDISETSGVSLMTLGGVYRGARMGQYLKAKAVSEACQCQVSIAELCE